MRDDGHNIASAQPIVLLKAFSTEFRKRSDIANDPSYPTLLIDAMSVMSSYLGQTIGRPLPLVSALRRFM